VKPVLILIVEDDFIVAKIIEKSLISLGYAVAGLVSTGEDAIKKAESEKPDLILMDIRLQGEMDGISASEKIRDKLNIPVIFLTAFSDQSTFERALVTAPYGYIIKPFSANTLSTTIKVALKKKYADKKMDDRNFWLDSTMSSLPEGIITVNAEGNIILVNQAAEHMTGWKNNDAYGQPLDTVLTFIDPITEQPFRYYLTPILQEGIIGTIPTDSIVISKDMTRHLLDDSFASPIKNRSGEIGGAAIVLYARTVSPTGRRITEPDHTDEKIREISIAFDTQKGRTYEPATPFDAAGWYDRGNYLLFLRRYNDAVNAYSNALAMNHMSYQSWYGKGTALAKLNQTAEALEAFDQALSIHPRNSRILNAKGVLLKKIGKDEEADRCFELARLYSA
jgi:CheY-like chemotaxis protein